MTTDRVRISQGSQLTPLPTNDPSLGSRYRYHWDSSPSGADGRIVTRQPDGHFCSNWGTVFASIDPPDPEWHGFEILVEIYAQPDKLVPTNITSIPWEDNDIVKGVIRRCAGCQGCWFVHEFKPSRVHSGGLEPRDSRSSLNMADFDAKIPPQTRPQQEEAKHAMSSAPMRWVDRLPADRALPSNLEMLPPPELRYESMTSAIAAIQAWSRDHGYNVVKAASDKDKYVAIRCYKGGIPPESRTDRKEGAKANSRRGVSRMVGCPFRVKVTKGADDESYQVTVVQGAHQGHEAAPQVPLLRATQLTEEEKKLAEKMVGIAKPAAMRAQINAQRQAEGRMDLSSSVPLYNLSATTKQRQLDDEGTLEEALHAMNPLTTREKINAVVKRDGDGELHGIFVTHRELDLAARSFQHVLLVDATYSVNKHAYPLVQIIAPLPWRSHVPIACALIKSEDTKTFRWVLSCLKTYLGTAPRVILSDNSAAFRRARVMEMPRTKHLLCHWHATCNITSEGASCLEEDFRDEFVAEWKQLLHADTAGEADAQWKSMKTRFRGLPGGSEALEYVEDNWLIKENWQRIGKHHTDKIRHFGNRTTSTVEGSHSSMKASMPGIIARTRMSIPSMTKLVGNWWSIRIKQADTNLYRQKSEIPEKLRSPTARRLLGQILGKVAQNALLEVLEETTKLERKSPAQRKKLTAEYQSAKCLAGLPGFDDIVEDDETEGSDADESGDDSDVLTTSGRAAGDDNLGGHETGGQASETTGSASGRVAEAVGNTKKASPRVCVPWTVHGIPCKHRLVFILAERDHLEVEDFSAFHHLPATYMGDGAQIDFDDQETPLLEDELGDLVELIRSRIGGDVAPANMRERKEQAADAFIYGMGDEDPGDTIVHGVRSPVKVSRKRGANEKHHTRAKRLDTRAEKVAKRQRVTKFHHSRQCSNCKELGHNKRKCKLSVAEGAKKRKEFFESMEAELWGDSSQDSADDMEEEDSLSEGEGGALDKPIAGPSQSGCPSKVPSRLEKPSEKGKGKAAPPSPSPNSKASGPRPKPKPFVSRKTRPSDSTDVSDCDKDEALASTVNRAESWKVHERLMADCSEGPPFETSSNGHCGYEAIARQCGLDSAMDMRLALLRYLDDEQDNGGKVHQDFPQVTRMQAKILMRKVTPGGIKPNGSRAKSFEAGATKQHWFSSELAAYVATILQRPVCIFDKDHAAASYTYVPVVQYNASAGDNWANAIGLVFVDACHFQGVATRVNGPLPPMRLDVYSRGFQDTLVYASLQRRFTFIPKETTNVPTAVQEKEGEAREVPDDDGIGD